MAGEKAIKRAVNDVGGGLAGQVKDQTDKVIGEMLNKSIPAKNALGLSDAMIEGIYGQAYRLYNSGKYREALEMFKFLVMVNSTEAKYSMGLAACLHMLKIYDGAIQTYMMVGTLDPDSPIPHYHLSDCYIQLKDPVSAIVALDMAIKRAGNKPEYQAIKDRAVLTIESLRKEIGKEDQTKANVREKHKKNQ